MYECVECGRILSEDSVIRVRDRYEYWGSEVSDYRTCCAFCRGDIRDVILCEECGNFFPEEDIITYEFKNVCYECEEKLRSDDYDKED